MMPFATTKATQDFQARTTSTMSILMVMDTGSSSRLFGRTFVLWFSRRDPLQVKRGVERADVRCFVVTGHDGDAAIIDVNLAGLLGIHSQETGEVDPVDVVMSHHQYRLSGMAREQVFESCGHARLHVIKRFAAGIAKTRAAADETAIAV